MKGLNLVVVAFVLLLQGCSFYGINFEDKRTITIQKAPYMITVSGDIEIYDYVFVDKVLTRLNKK